MDTEFDRPLAFGMYLAVFIDLLGHRDLYSEISEVPFEGDPSRAQFTENVAKFIRSILFLKKDIDRFFASFDSYESDLPWPDELAEFREKMERRICKVQRFSDGLVVFVPLLDDGEHFPISSVYRALGGGALLMLSCLARESPIRGGIAVGGGVELTDGELFGPVLGMAYETESQVAQYPRIAVHPSVIKYLQAHTNIPMPSSNDEKYLKLMGDVCSEMIVQDVDGVNILHYLGAGAWGRIFDPGGDAFLEKAREFASREFLRHQQAGNSKLATRYLLLNSYLQSHGPEASAQ